MPSHNKYVIWIVDDDNNYLYAEKQFLMHSGFIEEVRGFNRGKDALSVLQDQNESLPDLLLVDICMPQMSGWEFMEMFKTIEKERELELPVIINTCVFAAEDNKFIQTCPSVLRLNQKPMNLAQLYRDLNTYYGKTG